MAAKDATTKKAAFPPYIPFKTFTGFVRKFKETVVPDTIDASVMRQYPGSTARQLKAALKALALMSETNAPTDMFTALVNSLDTGEWQPTLQKVVISAYGPIIGDLKIETATRAGLEKRFRDWGVDKKEVLDKCIAFYVAAMVAAGAKVSPHILERAKPRTDGKPRPRRGQQPDEGLPEGSDVIDAALPLLGTVRFTVPIPDKSAATMLLPPKLTVDDWEMVSTMVKAYITRRNKSDT